MKDKNIFESKNSPERHIDRLALLGLMHGLTPTHPSDSKILELACSSGSNIIPQAYTYPNAHFTGIDLNASAIELGQKRIQELKLSNIDLMHCDLQTYQTEHKFDYIICHGLFTWGTSSLTEKILNIIQKNLQTNGLSYLSYNILPGWNIRARIKEILHSKLSITNNEQINSAIIQDARKILEDLLKNPPHQNFNEQVSFIEEINNCLQNSDLFIHSELLSFTSHALVFKDFIEQISKHHLYYLCEANPNRNLKTDSAMLPYQEKINLEQDVDSKTQRSFRGSILTKVNTYIKTRLDKNEDLYISSHLVSEKKPDLYQNKIDIFYSHNGQQIPINSPFAKAILLLLQKIWPANIEFKDLTIHAKNMFSNEPLTENDFNKAISFIENLFSQSLANINLHSNKICIFPGSKLMAYPVAAIESQDRNWVTNLNHEYVELNIVQISALQFIYKLTNNLSDNLLEKIIELELLPQVNGKVISKEELIKDWPELFKQIVLSLAENALLEEI